MIAPSKIPKDAYIAVRGQCGEVSLTIHFYCYGWADFILEVGDQKDVVVGVSYITDPVCELVTSAIEMLGYGINQGKVLARLNFETDEDHYVLAFTVHDPFDINNPLEYNGEPETYEYVISRFDAEKTKVFEARFSNIADYFGAILQLAENIDALGDFRSMWACWAHHHPQFTKALRAMLTDPLDLDLVRFGWDRDEPEDMETFFMRHLGITG